MSEGSIAEFTLIFSSNSSVRTVTPITFPEA
jgi:hypothetical protein